MPSWLAESITIGTASAFTVVTPRMWTIKQLLLTFAQAEPKLEAVGSTAWFGPLRP
jgi:hypothetical protein